MMAEYFDFGTNLNYMVGTLEDNNYHIQKVPSYIKSFFGYGQTTAAANPEPSPCHKGVVDKQLLKVRDSICVVGYNWESVQLVKRKIASFVDQPLPLESLHIQKSTDLKEGALLVPKVVLVANHCPGKKLIDDDGDAGQLDAVYDEACDTGADILVIYLGLPRAIYPSVRHMVYHPRMADLVFPNQPILRSLAENYSLITVLEKSDFTSMQKNVIREWVSRPVYKDHPVYAKADQLVQMTFSDAEFWSESELYRFRKPVPYHTTTQYVSAYEDNSVVEKSKSRKKKKKTKKGQSSHTVPVAELISFDDGSAGGGQIELEMYNGEANGAVGENESLVGSLTV